MMKAGQVSIGDAPDAEEGFRIIHRNLNRIRSGLPKFSLSEPSPMAVKHAVDDYPFRVVLNAKDDPMGKVDEMTNLEGEFTMLWDHRTALR